MIVSVDPGSAVPPFEQIRVQIARMAASGVLVAGFRLPTIAQLANDLSLAQGTVARAYRELESEGVVTSRRRVGTVITVRPVTTPAGATDATEVNSAISDFVRRLRQLGVCLDDVLDQLRTAAAD